MDLLECLKVMDIQIRVGLKKKKNSGFGCSLFNEYALLKSY